MIKNLSVLTFALIAQLSFAGITPTTQELLDANPLQPGDLPIFTSSLAGAVPASGGGTTNFMRADGTWADPGGGGGGSPGGSDTQLQYNNAGSFGGSSWVYTATGTRLSVGDQTSNNPVRGHINIQDDQSNGALTIQRENASSAASMLFRRAAGTPTSPTALGANQNGGAIYFAQYDGTGSYPISSASVRSLTTATQSSSDHGNGIAFYGTAAGSTTQKLATLTGLSSTGKSRFCFVGTDQAHSFCMAADVTTDFQWFFPSTQGGANTFLKNDGSGNLSWVSAPAPTGTANRVAFFDGSGNLNNDANILYDGSHFSINVDQIPVSDNTNKLGDTGNTWSSVFTRRLESGNNGLIIHASGSNDISLSPGGSLQISANTVNFQGGPVSHIRTLGVDNATSGTLDLSLPNGSSSNFAIGFPASNYNIPNSAMVSDGTGQTTWKKVAAPDFGDGSDSDAHLDGTNTFSWALKVGSVYTLLRPVYLHDLTVDSGVTLISAHFSIYGTGTLANAGTIDQSGGSGANGDNAGAGGAAGDPPVFDAVGFLAAHEWGNSGFGFGGGVVGGNGSTTGGAGGNGPTPVGNSLLGSEVHSGAGGASGDGFAGVGQPGADAPTPNTPTYVRRIIQPPINITSIAQPSGGQPGGSGAGGGGDAVNSGGGGGGSGGGGGILAIYFDTLNNTGTISANGGNGGAGGSPLAGNTGGGGGGGGGMGGFIMLLNNKLTAAGTIQVNGGNGGSKGLKSGTGTDGVDGLPGDGGRLLHNVAGVYQ